MELHSQGWVASPWAHGCRIWKTNGTTTLALVVADFFSGSINLWISEGDSIFWTTPTGPPVQMAFTCTGCCCRWCWPHNSMFSRCCPMKRGNGKYSKPCLITRGCLNLENIYGISLRMAMLLNRNSIVFFPCKLLELGACSISLFSRSEWRRPSISIVV